MMPVKINLLITEVVMKSWLQVLKEKQKKQKFLDVISTFDVKYG